MLRSSPDIPRLMFILSLLLMIFFVGMAAGRFKVFPYPQIRYSVESLQLLFAEAGMITGTKPSGHVLKSRHEGSGVVQMDAARMQPGLTLVASFYDGGLQIRLLAEDGTVVQRWPVSSSAIWSDFDHVQPPTERPATDWNSMFNGVVALPDGSVVFPLHGLVKLDRCGEVVWKLRNMSHHSLEVTDRGSFWVPGRRYVSGESQHPPLDTPYVIDTVEEVSADGEVLREFAVLDALIQNDLLAELYANNRDFDPNPELDVVHLNDVEELPAALAGRFPQFRKGDLLLSLREGNMLVILDPDTLAIKWYQVGPWIQQHDADWQPDGTVTVFNNNYDASGGRVFGGSSVMKVDFTGGEVQTLYGERPTQAMYTSTQGDHQVLPNGNLLIVESNSGRLLEVTDTGDIVWEYINRYSDQEVVRIPDAVRYPPGYFQVEDWACD